MSLIKCNECGQEISSLSDVCIHCGCPTPKDVEPKVEINTEKKPNKKGKIILSIVAVIIVFIVGMVIYYYSTTVEMPSLYGATQENASLLLTSNSLTPQFIYEYNDREEGTVFSTFPYAYDRVTKNSSVTVYISKGPSYIGATDSTINWYHVGTQEDDWNFYAPYIKEGYLYIECQPTFGTAFNWKDNGFGTASINDTFTKKVPLSIKYENQNVAVNQQQKITLVIPVKDLDVNKPTTLYTRLAIERNNQYEEISVNFTISW